MGMKGMIIYDGSFNLTKLISIEDLRGVKGIGPKTIKRIEKKIEDVEEAEAFESTYNSKIRLEEDNIYLGDCLELMNGVPDNSIDMILADLPYGTTACSWDSVIPLNKLWKHYDRIVKEGGVIVLTASQPFSSRLVNSKPEMFKHEWIWEKNAGSNFGAMSYQPMKEHESVMVFGKGSINYNPIMEERAESGKERINHVVNYNTSTTVYAEGLDKKISSKRGEMRYPRSIQKFNRERGLHPTQKPVGLFEYLIKTYTDEGDIVLDNVIGSGTTAVASIRTGRKYIGIEKDKDYFDIANKRVYQAKKELGL